MDSGSRPFVQFSFLSLSIKFDPIGSVVLEIAFRNVDGRKDRRQNAITIAYLEPYDSSNLKKKAWRSKVVTNVKTFCSSSIYYN